MLPFSRIALALKPRRLAPLIRFLRLTPRRRTTSGTTTNARVVRSPRSRIASIPRKSTTVSLPKPRRNSTSSVMLVGTTTTSATRATMVIPATSVPSLPSKTSPSKSLPLSMPVTLKVVPRMPLVVDRLPPLATLLATILPAVVVTIVADDSRRLLSPEQPPSNRIGSSTCSCWQSSSIRSSFLLRRASHVP